MPPDVLRHLTLAHGIVAWFDALLLIATTVLLVRQQWLDKPWLLYLQVAATLGAITSFASGMTLEMHYRIHLRQRLFITSKSLGWLFERKMHLAFGVFTFATIALLLLVLARKDPRFFRAMRAAYGLATVFALASCVISTIVRTGQNIGH